MIPLHRFSLVLAFSITGSLAAQERDASRAVPESLRALLEDAIAQKTFPGAVLEVGRAEDVLYRGAFGTSTYEEGSPAVTVDTLFDLASLTKVVFATTVTMRLVESGSLAIEDRVQRHVPEFREGERERITLEHLLTHTSGLPAWRPLYESHEGLEDYRAAIVATLLEASPGERYRYSDLGIILLGCVLQEASEKDLETLLRLHLVEPLGLGSTFFRPAAELREKCAPTERCSVRGRLIQGEVHDENTWKLDGVSTHAGLFSTAADLGTFARMYLNEGRVGEKRFLEASTIARFTSPAGDENGHRALGWQKPSERASCGQFFSEKSFGHTGFTGTSLWIDPEADLYVVLLTNRVHPTRDNQKHVPFRRALHDAVRRALR